MTFSLSSVIFIDLTFAIFHIRTGLDNFLHLQLETQVLIKKKIPLKFSTQGLLRFFRVRLGDGPIQVFQNLLQNVSAIFWSCFQL